MKRNLKKPILGALFMVSATALSSCFESKGGDGDLLFWAPFGSTYTRILDGIVDEINDEMGIKVTHEDQSSYDKILTNMTGRIKSKKYPNVVVGYPDHFANYAGSRILEPLDEYVANYDAKHGTHLLDENQGGYYSKYLDENKKIEYNKDADAGYLSGIPFNKSTELMGYNGVFVDYCVYWCEQNPTVTIAGVSAPAAQWDLANVPKTWQEWKVKGLCYRHIMDTLCKQSSQGATTEHPAQEGAVVFGKQDYTGHAYDFEVQRNVPESVKEEENPNYSEKHLLLDFRKVERTKSRVIGWDASDNMFITLVRQWGGKYTELPTSELKKKANSRVGHILFNAKDYEGHNYQKTTIECMKYFVDMNLDLIFGVASNFDNALYCSDAYANNQVMFMICSSGGLSYNTAKWRNRFTCATIPYNAEATGIYGKSVISQGANLALTKQSGDKEKAFEFMVKLSTGEYQTEWCLQSGYYPATKEVADSTTYQNMLNEVELETQKGTPEKAYLDSMGQPSGTKVAYREGAKINTDHYMVSSEQWDKFTDDPFVGSSAVRKAVKAIFTTAFTWTRTEADKEKNYTDVLHNACVNGSKDNTQNVVYHE